MSLSLMLKTMVSTACYLLFRNVIERKKKGKKELLGNVGV